MDNKLLTFEETRLFLNTTTSHLRSLIFYKKIPYKKINRLVRFDLEEIKAWISQNGGK